MNALVVHRCLQIVRNKVVSLKPIDSYYVNKENTGVWATYDI